MHIRNQALSYFELQVFFKKTATQEQIYYISSICRALGIYLVLDRDMLQERLQKKISIRFLEKAANWGLITELISVDEETGDKKFFYQLNVAGIGLLRHDKYPLHLLPLSTNHFDRSRILTFNRYILDQEYEHAIKYPLSRKFDFFIATNEKNGKYIGCYFNDMINEVTLIKKLYNIVRNPKAEKPEPIDIVYKKFERFEPINSSLIIVSPKANGVYYSEHKDE